MSNQKPSFRFEIDNFSEKEAAISSQAFESGGCEWYLHVDPKRDRFAKNHLSSYLRVANPKSLRTGWKRSAGFYFVVLNESDKELYISPLSWGFRKTLPLSKLQEKGVLENDKLIIEVYINFVQAVNGEGEEDVSKEKETMEINGFQVLASQVTSVRKLFAENPDIAEDFKPKNKALKTAYMNVLLNLIKKLEKPPKSLSETELRKASSKLSELMDVGFKLKWLKLKLEEISLEKKKLDDDDEYRVQKLEEPVKNLELMESGIKMDSLKSKLEEVSLERKKADADVSMFQQLEKRVKNLELMETGFKLESLKTKLDEVSLEWKKENSRAQQLQERLKNLEVMELGFKLDSLETKLDEVSLERNKSDDADESRAQKLEERVKNLELMELGYQLDCLYTKLKEVSLERKKSDYVYGSRVQQLEESIKKLGMMELGFKLDCLNTKLEEVSLERKKSDDADGSRIQQLEESVQNIELMLSCLKDELDKKKDKSSADGFLLVDDFA